MEISTVILNMRSRIKDNPFFEIDEGKNYCTLYYLGNRICEVSCHNNICYYETCNDLESFYYSMFLGDKAACERHALLEMYDLLDSLICLQKLFSEDDFYNHIIFNIRY